MIIANAIAALLFAASAVLQYNDPDPWGWAAIYTAAALACLAYGRIRFDRVAAAAVLVAAVAWGAVLTPDVLAEGRPGDAFRSMDDPGAAAELVRELGGLALVALWMAVLVARPGYRRRHGAQDGRPVPD